MSTCDLPWLKSKTSSIRERFTYQPTKHCTLLYSIERCCRVQRTPICAPRQTRLATRMFMQPPPCLSCRVQHVLHTPVQACKMSICIIHISTQLHLGPPHRAACRTSLQPPSSHSVLFQPLRSSGSLFWFRGVTLPRTLPPPAPPLSAASPITF